ncbi:MAG TPA: hypothetical protein VNT79_02900 [Phycisphaerae bacterium]|nr:hypothetical protein [Phycisphaerae bacterium]
MGISLLFLVLLALLVASYAFASRLTAADEVAGSSFSLSVLTLQIFFACLISVGLILGVTGALVAGIALPAIGAVGAILWFAGRRQLPHLKNWTKQPTQSRFTRILTAALAALIVWRGCRAIVSPEYAYDALTYHLFFPARWIQDGFVSIIPTWFSDPAPAYAPCATEVFYALLMMPLQSDILARGGQFWFWVLLIATFGGLLEALRVGPKTRFAGCIAVALIPTLGEQAITAMVDIALAAHLLAVVLFALRFARQRLIADAIGLALSIGLAVGTKFLALAYLLPLAPLLLWSISRRNPGRLVPPGAESRFRKAALGAGMICAIWIGAFWYARNCALTGNPVYPLDVKVGNTTVFPGAYGRAQMENSTFNIRRRGGLSTFIAAAVEALPGNREASSTSELHSAHGVVAFVPIALIACLFLAASTTSLVRRPIDAGILLCCLGALGMLAIFWWMVPFQEPRFLWTPLLLMFALGLGISTSAPRFAAVVACVAAGVWALAAIPSESFLLLAPFAWYWLAVAIIVGLVAVTFGHRPGTIAGVVMLGMVSLIAHRHLRFHDPIRERTYAHPRWAGAGELWSWFDRNPGPWRIAYVGNNTPYFLLGPKFSNHVEYVSARSPMIYRYDEAAADTGWLALGPANTSEAATDRRVMNPEAWLRNLIARDIGYIAVFPLFRGSLVTYRHDANGYTVERDWLEILTKSFIEEDRPALVQMTSKSSRSQLYAICGDLLEKALPPLPNVTQEETDAIHRRDLDGTPPGHSIRFYPHAAGVIEADRLRSLK